MVPKIADIKREFNEKIKEIHSKLKCEIATIPFKDNLTSVLEI
ncbi:hypothetical protein V6M85_02115 [Sulfolobus tengchongensis]|uniref:Uncharacterized protein n=1 Tax=Sulfolobus tengchongensis TaxID=207809 RepID=A0AAX4L2I9_9CREN